MKLAQWQERVIEERRELLKKIEKLRVICEESEVPVRKGDLDILGKQFFTMRKYADILDKRIERFS